jgi:hypothetical protein
LKLKQSIIIKKKQNIYQNRINNLKATLLETASQIIDHCLDETAGSA